MRFEIVPQSGENSSQVVAITFNSKGAWHRVEVDYKEQLLYLDIDYKFTRRDNLGVTEFGSHVMLASSNRRNTGVKLIMPQIKCKIKNKNFIRIGRVHARDRGGRRQSGTSLVGPKRQSHWTGVHGQLSTGRPLLPTGRMQTRRQVRSHQRQSHLRLQRHWIHRQKLPLW